MPNQRGWGRAEPAPRCRSDGPGYHCSSDSCGGPGGAGCRRSPLFCRAGVAHLVERDLAKVEVAGSKPVSRSTSPFASLRLGWRETSVDSAGGPGAVALHLRATSLRPLLTSKSIRGIQVLLWRRVDVSGNRCRRPSDCPSQDDEQDCVLRTCLARRHADCDKDNPNNRGSDAVCGAGIQPISHIWGTPRQRLSVLRFHEDLAPLRRLRTRRSTFDFETRAPGGPWGSSLKVLRSPGSCCTSRKSS